MSTTSISMAKLAGFKTAISSMLATTIDGARSGARAQMAFPSEAVLHYFVGTQNQIEQLRQAIPELFDDFAPIRTTPAMEMQNGVNQFSRMQLAGLVRDIDHIFEIRANSELAQPISSASIPQRVFITHGRSNDWREVQAFIEKDANLPTLELAQEVNLGSTVIEKLEHNAAKCDSAVIVMTGDDTDAGGQARARENVMHEIGFFQGRFGRKKVVLLHEEGVSIPTNLSGVVYVPFPKGSISAGFHVLARELNALYGR
jgi:predicted nucleotide-binding protein